MTPKHRLEAADAIELAHHALAKLAAEGWVVERVDQRIEHRKVGKGRLPVAAVVTVRLVPR